MRKRHHLHDAAVLLHREQLLVVHVAAVIGQRADAECEAMTGAFDSAAACIIDAFDGCETSTIMPTRFISAITCRPSG